MRHNTHDKTLYRNYVRKWKFLIQEYELVKQKHHPKFRFVADFYRFHQTHRQTFLKYYHLVPQVGRSMPWSKTWSEVEKSPGLRVY